jgi:DNA polymerase-3 subunit delta
MSFDILKKEIKSGIFRNIYLFFGPERYLIEYYTNNLKDLLLKDKFLELNYLLLEGDNASLEAISEFCEALPIMSDKKLLIIKKSSFFKTSKSKNSGNVENVVNYMQSLPDYIHIISPFLN